MKDVLLNLDYQIFQFFNGLTGYSETLDVVFVILAEFVVYLLIAGLALFVFHHGKERIHRRAALFGLASALIAKVGVVSLIHLFYIRLRPFVAATVTQLVAMSPHEASFPSSHTTIMFAIATSVWFADRRWGRVYFVLATLSGLSRVVVGVHYPLDIVGGVVVGVLAAVGLRYCVKDRFKV